MTLLYSGISSVMIILCSCIEAVQIATDGFVVCKMRKGQPTEFSREKYFHNHEDVVYNPLIERFHRTYKTRKTVAQHCFNPIRDGLRVDSRRGIDEQSVDLVNQIKLILVTHSTALQTLINVIALI